jgi:hypothetical protein
MADNPIEWIKRNFFSKRNFTDVSNGVVDSFRPVVLGIDGYLEPSLHGSFGAWTNLTYTNSGGTTWTDYGGVYQPGQYRIVGDMVYIRGLCKRTAGAGGVIATLPAGVRPVNRTLMIAMTNTGEGQIDIYSDGTINLISGGATFVSLNYPPFSIL